MHPRWCSGRYRYPSSQQQIGCTSSFPDRCNTRHLIGPALGIGTPARAIHGLRCRAIGTLGRDLDRDRIARPRNLAAWRPIGTLAAHALPVRARYTALEVIDDAHLAGTRRSLKR